MLYSRSARDLSDLAREYPGRIMELARQLARHMAAAEPWAAAWPDIAREIGGKPLAECG